MSEDHISVTASLAEHRPHTLKHGDTFAVFDTYGDLAEHSSQGIYHQDTRYLSRLELSVQGGKPLLLSSAMQSDNTALVADLVNPDTFEEDVLVWPKNVLHFSRVKFLWQAACYEMLKVEYFGSDHRRVSIALDFSADFADMFEVRGQARAARGPVTASVADATTVKIVYGSLDDRSRCTHLHFDPPPAALSAGHAAFELDLVPGRRLAIFTTIRCVVDGVAADADARFFSAMRKAKSALRTAQARGAKITTSNTVVNEILRRSRADIDMLGSRGFPPPSAAMASSPRWRCCGWTQG
jgi:glycogen debranching enzyme